MTLVALTMTSTISSTITAGALVVFGLLLLPVLAQRGVTAQLGRDPFVLYFLLAIALSALVCAVTADQVSDLYFVGNFTPLLFAIPVYVLARRLGGLRTLRIVVALCFAGCVVAMAVAIYTVLVLHFPRADGLLLTGSLIYARLAVLLGFIAAAGCLIPGSPSRYIYLLGPVISTAICVLAGARGVILCVPFLLLLLLVFLMRERTGRERWMIVGGLAALCVAGAAVALPFVDMARILTIPRFIIDVMSGNGAATDGSIQSRLAYYGAAVTLFDRAPIFGYGWANLRDAAFTVLDPVTNADFFSYHNDVLNFAVAGGVIGILTLVIILAAPLAGVLSSQRDRLFVPRLYCVLVIVVLYALGGLTDHVMGYDMPTFAFAFMSAIVLGAFRERPDEVSPSAASRGYRP